MDKEEREEGEIDDDLEVRSARSSVVDRASPSPLPPPGVFSRSFSSNAIDDDQTNVEVFLINH